METTAVSIMIDSNLKSGVESILQMLGLTFSEAVTIFARQVYMRRKLPFAVELPPEEEMFNSETVAALEEGRAIMEGRVKAKTYASMDELHAEIEAEIAAEKSE